MLLRDAIALFERKNLACMIPDGRTGEMRDISATRLAAIVSAVNGAVRQATGISDRKALGDVELEPYLAVLPELAHRYAKAQGNQRPANYVSDVRTFLHTIEGRAPEERIHKRRVSVEAFASGWRPLGQALLDVKNERWKKYAGWLERLQQIALLNGARGPEELVDYCTVKGWCTAAGLTDKEAGDLLTAWRKARELAGQLALSDLQPPTPASHRGIHSLPDLDAKLAACRPRLDRKRMASAARRGEPAPPAITPTPAAEMSTIELIQVLAPEAAKALRLYLKHASTTALKSDDWRETAISAVSKFVAELYRLPPTLRPGPGGAPVEAPEEPFALDLRQLFTERRLVTARAIARAQALVGTAVGGTDQEARDEFDLELDALHEVHDVMYDEVPLIRILVDAAARRSYVASQLYVDAEQAQDGDVPLYTHAIFNDLMALWSVVGHAYGEYAQFRTKKAAEWREMERTYEALKQEMNAHNETREVRGHKNKTLLTLNYGQAVCVGVPALWRTARELRAQWLRKEEAYARALAEGSAIDLAARRAARALNPVRRARRDYFEALRTYITAAVILDDMMRIKNYARGRVGSGHSFVPILEREAVPGQDASHGALVHDALGRPRLKGMQVTFRGFDRTSGTKARRKAGTGQERKRTRTLSVGVVDNELLADFLFELRPEDLVRSGKLASVEDYSLEKDHWAFFTQPDSKRDDCGYDTARLSKRFGRIIHWMHRDLLRLRDAEQRELPAWEELMARTTAGAALRRVYRALFSQHFVRVLGASYLIGVLDDYAEVMHRTNDTRHTLDTFYAELSEVVSEAQKLEGIRNPDWFKPVMEQLLRGRVIDWATFDPLRPETARVVTGAPAPVSPPRRSRRPRVGSVPA